MTTETNDERPFSAEHMLSVVELHEKKLRRSLAALKALEDDHDPELLRLAAEHVRKAVVDFGVLERASVSMANDLAYFWTGAHEGGWLYRAVLSLPILALALENAAERPSEVGPGHHGHKETYTVMAVRGLYDHVEAMREWIKSRTQMIEEDAAA